MLLGAGGEGSGGGGGGVGGVGGSGGGGGGKKKKEGRLGEVIHPQQLSAQGVDRCASERHYLITDPPGRALGRLMAPLTTTTTTSIKAQTVFTSGHSFSG